MFFNSVQKTLILLCRSPESIRRRFQCWKVCLLLLTNFCCDHQMFESVTSLLCCEGHGFHRSWIFRTYPRFWKVIHFVHFSYKSVLKFISLLICKWDTQVNLRCSRSGMSETLICPNISKKKKKFLSSNIQIYSYR